MADVGKEKVYPMSKNVYLGESYEPRFTFAANWINLLLPNNNQVFDLFCYILFTIIIMILA
jgi:hypothetical protein